MTEHPITPPPELVEQWVDIWRQAKVKHVDIDVFVATQAARWGANIELDACCKEIQTHPGFEQPELFVELLLDKRRPKPTSLKKQALAVLDEWCDQENGPGESIICNGLHVRTIRRALEALPDAN